jgi:hypothetical protein
MTFCILGFVKDQYSQKLELINKFWWVSYIKLKKNLSNSTDADHEWQTDRHDLQIKHSFSYFVKYLKMLNYL